ncbi:PREDICTED: cell growth-regulating nucleolar protein [Papilio xuthus]|uniref:Cell growth-regulating nucleolar protein n=1 Tax=Papilio xuthus TaxID=66420 RepID=A0AAJ6Z4Q8_PAPXU|nr:PREDICTED: cell growth-regulating nucleolar protein [Papilio xuthus]
MVVFTCGHCGESVQKPKVEKHYLTKCRNRTPNLSCMDCFKDFLGNDYEAHIKCITEEERYSGKGFTAKEKKGEKKQNAWVEMLQSVLDETETKSPNVLRIIETISKHNNTPRKKPKFINFVKNVCGQKTNQKDIDQAWDLISVKLAALSQVNGHNKNNSKENVNGDCNGKSKDKPNGNTKDNIENGDKVDNATEKTDNEAESNVPIKNGNCDVPDKKLSKKQRKEEKKKKKYEAELQDAEQPAEEEVAEVQSKKKGKKNKNKDNKTNGTDEAEDNIEGKNKNKKRKRQDTVNTIPEVVDEIAIEEPIKVKAQQKKKKVDAEEDSVTLHDQNVAKSEEQTSKSDKFNWHAVIVSVLQKKDNEVPFKRLQKKVLSEYSEITGNEVDDRIAEKFIKKLKSAPNVRVDKNRVVLVQESDD